MSRRQEMTFTALEQMGNRIYVFWTERPDSLLPWRRFTESNILRSRASHLRDEIGRLQRAIHLRPSFHNHVNFYEDRRREKTASVRDNVVQIRTAPDWREMSTGS